MLLQHQLALFQPRLCCCGNRPAHELEKERDSVLFPKIFHKALCSCKYTTDQTLLMPVMVSREECGHVL